MTDPTTTSPATLTTGGPTTPPGEHVLTRVFEAPRELVFRCMVEPEHLSRFWGPTGTSTPLENITVDARPGGVFETVMVSDSDGSTFAMRAVFDVVDPPERLVWTERDSGVTTTTTFVELGAARTEVRIHRRNLPAWFLTPEALSGFASSLDELATYLAEQVSR